MKHTIPARKKLTALALTQPQEMIPVGELTNIIRFDSKPCVVKSAIEMHELTEIKNLN